MINEKRGSALQEFRQAGLIDSFNLRIRAAELNRREYGQAVETGKRLPAFVKHGAGDGDAVDRIGPVEYHEAFAIVGSGLHGVTHGRDIGIKSAADILDIEDQCVDIFEHVTGRNPRVAIQAKNPNTSTDIFGVINQRDVQLAEKSVFGTEQHNEIDLACIVQQLYIADTGTINARMVRDQSDIPAEKCPETIALQHIDPGQDNTGVGIRRGKAYGRNYCQQGKLHDTDKHDDRLH